MHLYDLAVEGQELERILEETQGELTAELEQRFDALLSSGRDKIEAALMVRKKLEYEANACRLEADRLTKRARSLENQRGALSERVRQVLDLAFSGKLKTAKFSVWTEQRTSFEYQLAPDVSLEELSRTRPDLIRTLHEFNKVALNELNKDHRLPAEFVASEMVKRILQVR